MNGLISKKRIRRFFSAIVACVLVIQSMTPVFAYTGDTINNTADQNLTILQKLQSLYGDDLTQADIENELANMGMLDGGNINVSQSILVDGQAMTLEQVEEMIGADGTDLNRMVDVDGTKISLADLKKMIEIENELARIKATYFSDAVPLTPEHEESLNSLFSQIETTGISLQSGDLTTLAAEIPINHHARIKVANVSPSYAVSSNPTVIWMEFWLVDENGSKITLDYDVSFDWRLLDGAAVRGTHFDMVTGYAPDGTLTINKGTSIIAVPIQISKIINYISPLQDPANTYANAQNRWQGEKTFMIQLYNPINILFEGGMRAKDIPIKIHNGYTWTVALNENLSLRSIPVSSAGVPYFEYNFNYDNIKTAAIDIFGSVADGTYEVDMSGQLVSLDTTAYEMTAKPQYLDENGDVIPDNKFYNDGNWFTVPYASTYDVYAGNDANGESSFYYARIYGMLPSVFKYSGATYSTAGGYPSTQMNYINRSIDISIFDIKAPEVRNMTAPTGSYYSGQVIPVTVEFSEPVKLNGLQLYMQGDDTPLAPAESSDTVSKYATFLYTVPKSPNNSLIVSRIKNINGLVDSEVLWIYKNRTASWPSDGHLTTLPGVTMSMDSLGAIDALSLDNVPASGSYAPNDTIEVSVDVDTDVSQWLEDDYDLSSECLQSVYIKAGGRTYPLTMGGSGGQEGTYYTAEIPAQDHADADGKTLVVELCTEGTYVPETDAAAAYFTGGTTVIGKYASAAIAPLILVESVGIDPSTYPLNNKIYLTQDNSVQLAASVSPETANYKTIKWQSSDATVASIDETTGVITPIRQGTVSFRAVADNSAMGAPVYAETPEFTISDGGVPAILFPQGNNAFVTKKNEEVTILWSQNIIGRTVDVAAVFDITVFDGSTPVYTTATTDASRVTIPENILSRVSEGTDPAYTVQVQTVNPDNSQQILSAVGYIIVYPQQAKVQLNKLDSYYITDETTSLDIGWVLSEFGGGDFEFKVVKNQSTLYATSTNNGHYALTIDPVSEGTLKDTYTVSIKVKNTQDGAWSNDSFVLHVYSRNAMKIKVGGLDRDTLVMDNTDRIENIYNTSGSDGVLALKRDINLKNYIGINADDYVWGSMTDQIQWQSENSDTASVNYRQGTLYENIEKFSYTAYRPATQFMLAGNEDGATRITATHAATGMQDILDVNVTTLKNKLYLFSFYPKQETTLSYKNGLGESRTAVTNYMGEIAVYEESGIAGNISLRSGSGSSLCLGTIYPNNLVSGEKDPGIFELYPVNAFKLRPAAKVELFFKDKDGNPFTGSVTYRGAVYKNGEICTQTMESDGQAVSIGSDGKFTLTFDTTKFWTDNSLETLQGSDQLDFIYEVMTSDGAYFPRLLTVNGSISMEDTVKFGESIVNMLPVQESDKSKPFISSQVINYNLKDGRRIDVTNYMGAIGPGNMYSSVELETMVALWGQDQADSFDVKIEDEYGAVIEGQKVKTIRYPFATMAYAKNITTLSEATLNLELGKTKGAAVSIYDASGTLMKNTACPFAVTNMVGAAQPDEGIQQAAQEMRQTGEKEFDLQDGMSGGNQIIGLALQAMADSEMPFGDLTMYVNIAATEDPMVYRGIITKRLQMNSTDTSDVSVELGGADTSFQYTYDPETMTSVSYDLLDAVMNPPSPFSADIDAGVKLAGYFEVEVRYDKDAGKWVMVVIGGGMDLDALFGASVTMNGMVGPIPVTADLAIGAAENLTFRAVKPYGSVPSGIDAADVNDFYTSLRIKAYVSAFGGLGFDYSLVALKIGVFGKANLDYSAEFVNKPYMIEGDGLYAYLTKLGIYGQVGVKFVATILHVSYETVLASIEGGTDFWVEGAQYRTRLEEWKNRQTSSLLGFEDSTFVDMIGASASLKIVDENVGYESRDYLNLYDRSWGSASEISAMSAAASPTDIQTNAYPYANPVTTRDGEIMAYMSDSDSQDVNDTRASWAVSSTDGYVDQGALPTLSGEAHADSNINLDGTKEFAAAVWEHQRMKLDASQAPAAEDIAAMMNSSEVVASIYEDGSWTTTSLTDNLLPDMAPVVAANNGRAVVAWRSLAGSDTQDLLTADLHDAILYKVYENGSWSEVQTLYNGNAGNVRGFSAAMMQDGTAAIVYTVNAGAEETVMGYETLCAVIGSDNSIKADIRLTNNDSADQNPQIVAAGMGAAGDEFIIGWYNAQADGTSDIKLAAIDKDGRLDSNFVDSVNSMYGNAHAGMTSNFKFTRKDGSEIDALSILWVQPDVEYDEAVDNTAQCDRLKAVKFMVDENGGIYLTSPLDVAEMAPYTLIDHFDAFADDQGSITALMLTSAYIGELQNQGNDVYTVDSISSIQSVTARYSNGIEVGARIDYEEVKSGFSLPITFTLSNTGILPIESVDIALSPDQIRQSFEDLNLLPNQSMMLTVDYEVPESDIHDLTYAVDAHFSDGETAASSGMLDVDVPDSGISKLELVSDEQGERVIQATLRNSGDVKLAGSDRKAHVGIYTSSLFDEESAIAVQEIAESEMTLLDNGALTLRFTYDVPDEGIPSGGTRLYCRIWVEEYADGTWSEIDECFQNDNIKSILLQNPIEANNGRQFLVKVEQENNPVTTAYVTVKNLSMTPSTHGNVILKLLDNSGSVMETKFLAASPDEWLDLSGEESVTRAVQFDGSGARVVAEYFTASTDASTHEISVISLSGINMNFDEAVKNYELTADNLNSTLITAVAQSSADTVEVWRADGKTLLATGTGAAVYAWSLPEGQTSGVQVRISGNASEIYNIHVTNVRESSGAVILEVAENARNRAFIEVMADGLTNFHPVQWQYVQDGVWSDTMEWNASGSNRIELFGEGDYRIAARLIAGDGYYIDSQAKAISVEGNERKTKTVSTPVANPVYYEAVLSGAMGSQLQIAVDRNIASVDLGVLAEAMLQGEQPAVINMPEIEGVLAYSLKLPADYLTGAQAKQGSVTIATAIGDVKITSDMLASLSGVQGKEAEIIIEEIDKTDLSEGLKAGIGDRPLIQISLKLDGTLAEWRNPNAPVTVSIPYIPTEAELKHPEHIVIWYLDGTGNKVAVPNGRYDATTGNVVFQTTHFSDFAVAYNPIMFTDVAETAWYNRAVNFIAAREITKGTGINAYCPDAKLTRGQFIVMLMKAYGIDADAAATGNFSDAGNTYYTPYLATARGLGITNGIGDNRFAPDQAITRQEMFALLYNALNLLNLLPQGDAEATLADYQDSEQVDVWAREAMSVFVETGSISGSNGNLNPKGTTTRAEMAQVLYNLLMQ